MGPEGLVFKLEQNWLHGRAFFMSRPQFQQRSRYSSTGEHSATGGVVNGGLIDFQDNTRRGLPIDMSQQIDYGTGLPASLHVQGLAQAGALSGLGQGAGAGCFSGPPSFLHVNGVTYRPVESPDPRAVMAPAALPVPTSSSHGSEVGAEGVSDVAGMGVTGAQAVSTKLLTEAELNRIVDDRVRQRVSAQVKGYLTRKPGHYSDDMQDLGSRVRHSASGSLERVERSRHEDERPRAAERVERSRYDEDDRPRATERVERSRYDEDERPRAAARVERSKADDLDERGGRHAVRSRGGGGSSYDRDSDMESAAARVRRANASMSERVVRESSRSPSRKEGVVW